MMLQSTGKFPVCQWNEKLWACSWVLMKQKKKKLLVWHIKYRHLIIIVRSIWCRYPCDLTYAGNSWHFDNTISMLQDLICDQCFHERWKCNLCWHTWLLFHLCQIRLSLLKDIERRGWINSQKLIVTLNTTNKQKTVKSLEKDYP